jgi:hyperosmotically inducible protein
MAREANKLTEKDKSMSIQGHMLSAVFLGALLVGCSTSATKSPDVTPQIRQSLDQAGLKSVDIKQDREKGVVTLSGNVNADADKAQAESIAKSIAGTEVVSNQIAVRPPGDQSATKDADSALDSGIEQNVKAMLIQHKLNHDVNYDVKNGVVTLTGKVNSQSKRSSTEQLTAAIPNVKQVVNELQVKNQKATSSR